jgi:hypothetical protein
MQWGRLITYINFLPPFIISIKSCEISSSHGGEYEVQICLLGCTTV